MSCFIFHDWTNWETEKTLFYVHRTGKQIEGTIQARYCKKCNLRESKR